MTKLFFVLTFSLVLLSCGQPKADKLKDRIDMVCDEFMQDFKEGRLPEAMSLLKQNSVIAASAIDTLQGTIRSQMKNIFSGYGRMLSYELVSEFKVKNSLAKRLYILKFEQTYLKFDFTLYNNGKDWMITGFNYNDRLDELLK